jgi:hypothetical protein
VDGEIVFGENSKIYAIANSGQLEEATFFRNPDYRDEGEVCPVSCSTLRGVFVRVFSSLADASEVLQLEERDMRACCMGRQRHIRGLVFKWASEEARAKHAPVTAAVAAAAAAAGAGAAGDGASLVKETKSAIGLRLKTRILSMVRDLCDDGEEVTADNIYRLILPEFEGKGVLPTTIEAILIGNVKKGYMLVNEEQMMDLQDTQAHYVVNPLYRTDFETAPILCLTADHIPLRVFASIKELESLISVDPVAVLNVLLKVNLKTTRSLKFIWLDHATTEEVEAANNHEEDTIEYIQSITGVARGSDPAEAVVRRKMSRVRQYSTNLQSFAVPGSITDIFTGHEIMDGRVKRSMTSSQEASGASSADLPKKRGRPKKKTFLRAANENSGSEEEDEEDESSAGEMSGYNDRHNTKGNEIEAAIPELIEREPLLENGVAGVSVVQREDFMAYSTTDVALDREALARYLRQVKLGLYPSGKVLKVRIPDGGHAGGRGRKNDIMVVCCVGEAHQADPEASLEEASQSGVKLSVFDGDNIHSVDLENCLLEREDDFLNIFWKHFYSNTRHSGNATDVQASSTVPLYTTAAAATAASLGCKDDTGSLSSGDMEIDVDISNAAMPSQSLHAPSSPPLLAAEAAIAEANELVQSDLQNQWSYQEIVEFIGMLKMNPGEPDLSGKYCKTRKPHSSRSRKEVVTLYYSIFCPLNRNQSYSQLRNVFSCAEFMKGHYNPVETAEWLLRNGHKTGVHHSTSCDSLTAEKNSFLLREMFDEQHADGALPALPASSGASGTGTDSAADLPELLLCNPKVSAGPAAIEKVDVVNSSCNNEDDSILFDNL